ELSRTPAPHGHDPGAEPDPLRPRRHLGEEHRGVVRPRLGQEEAGVASALRLDGEPDDRRPAVLERHHRDGDGWSSRHRSRRHRSRIRSYRPYSRAASMNQRTQSGSARGGNSHEVESTKRERGPTVSMQRRTSASISARLARSKIVTSTLPIPTTPRALPSVTSLSSWS